MGQVGIPPGGIGLTYLIGQLLEVRVGQTRSEVPFAKRGAYLLSLYLLLLCYFLFSVLSSLALLSPLLATCSRSGVMWISGRSVTVFSNAL